MTTTVLRGVNTIVMARKLNEADAKDAYMIPYLTSTDFDPSRDSDTTETKSGSVATIGKLSTDFSFELLDNDDPILDVLHQSLLNKDKLEFWIVKLDKKNNDNKKYAHYIQGLVTEDSFSGDADSDATREFTITVDGSPKSGYTTVPENIQNQIDYVFKGISKTQTDKTGGGVAEATAETPTPSVG